MKRGKLRKQGKSSISKIQRELWVECRRIVREQFGNTCFTCGAKNLVGRNLHTGHLIPKASCGAYLKYDLRILRPQCYNCNINLGGNGAEFYRKMIIAEGATYVNELIEDKKVTVKAYDHYTKLLEEYKRIK